MTRKTEFIEGNAKFTIASTGETAETNYQIYGDLNSSKPPLVVLHGGPGLNGDYMLPLKDVRHSHGIPVILYDQIGNGRSTHFPNKKYDQSFWSMELFIAELENLLSTLSIKQFDLVGHSWGGILAADFVIRRQPKGLRRLILYSTVASGEDIVKYQRQLLTGFPQYIQDAVDHAVASDDFQSPEFLNAMQAFGRRHGCRIDPQPIELIESLEWIAKDATVYHTIVGETEFKMTGWLKDWDIKDQLHKITVPTLIMNGEYDVLPEMVQWPFFNNIPHVKWFTFAGLSHLTMMEAPEKVLAVIAQFLTH